MRILLIISSLFLCNAITAQNYKNGVGIKYEIDFAVTAKHFFDDENCIEVSFGFRDEPNWEWTKLSAAYLRHCHLPKSWGDNLRWYYGAGPSLYTYTSEATDMGNYASKDRFFGINGYLGTEFTFPHLPIAISSTWAPTIFINGYTEDLGLGYGSFSLRYTFK